MRRSSSLLRSLQAREVSPRNFYCTNFSFQWVSDSTMSGSGLIDLKTCSPPLALAFSKTRGSGHLLAISNEDGYIKVFDTRREFCSPANLNESMHKAAWLAHHNAIFDLQWTQDDTHMLTASGDQTIKLWNVESQAQVGRFSWHTGSIKSINVHPLCPSAFVSSGRDGNVALWDARGNQPEAPVAFIRNAHGTKSVRAKKCAEAVTAVLYLADGFLLATAGHFGAIKFWDTRNLKKPLTSTRTLETPEGLNERYGYTCLSADASGNIIGSATNSEIHMYNVNAPEKGAIKTFSGHCVRSYYVKASFSPDGARILSGSSDGSAYVWKLNECERPLRLEGHTSEVTSVDWCSSDASKFATCSDDFTARVWLPQAVLSQRHLEEESSVQEIQEIQETDKMDVTASPVSVLATPRCRTTKQQTLESWFV